MKSFVLNQLFHLHVFTIFPPDWVDAERVEMRSDFYFHTHTHTQFNARRRHTPDVYDQRFQQNMDPLKHPRQREGLRVLEKMV